MSLLPGIAGKKEPLEIWLIDRSGNVAVRAGLRLLARSKRLHVPFFARTEQATAWGSRLNANQHATLVDIQRRTSNAALGVGDLQQMVDLATQAQLLREAGEAFMPDFEDTKHRPFLAGGPTHAGGGSRN